MAPAGAPNRKGDTNTWKPAIAGATVAIAAFLLATLAIVSLRSKPEAIPTSILSARPKASISLPFTTLPGSETAPAFSPDGSRIAFAWDRKSEGGQGGYDLYVKAIGSETLLRLTHHPSVFISSVWSPDGTQIAIHRMARNDSGIYLIPALGGTERKLTDTHPPYFPATRISWSPDGKWIAYTDPLPTEPLDRMFRVSVETLEVQPIQHNPACLHEAFPTFSHDGKTLFYACVHAMHRMEIYSVPVMGTARHFGRRTRTQNLSVPYRGRNGGGNADT